jgi:hypothetical protein
MKITSIISWRIWTADLPIIFAHSVSQNTKQYCESPLLTYISSLYLSTNHAYIMKFEKLMKFTYIYKIKLIAFRYKIKVLWNRLCNLFSTFACVWLFPISSFDVTFSAAIIIPTIFWHMKLKCSYNSNTIGILLTTKDVSVEKKMSNNSQRYEYTICYLLEFAHILQGHFGCIKNKLLLRCVLCWSLIHISFSHSVRPTT